jgi:hypothetical protein
MFSTSDNQTEWITGLNRPGGDALTPHTQTVVGRSFNLGGVHAD